MNRTKRIISVMLAVFMAVSMLSACQADGTGAADDGVVVLRAMQWEPENLSVDFANLWYFQELEEETGVRVEWTVVKESEWNTAMNLMFVSGEYPDIIIRPNLNLNIEEYGVTQGILIPLDDYINADVMPNYYSRLRMNNANASIPASDGKSYHIGYLVAQNVNHDGSFYINRKWLDAVEMEVPATVDELTEVLIAFRDEIPGLLGIETVFPFSAGGSGGVGGGINHQTNGLYVHFAMFGVPIQRWVYAVIDEDHNVVFPGYMDGFRAALEWMHMCYTEGLLDREAITQDTNVWSTKMNAEQVGFTSHLRMLNAGLDAVNDQWVSILPPASEFGVSVPRILEIPDFGAVLTVANKNVEATMRWLDAQFDTERMMVAANGPLSDIGTIGTTLKVNEEGKYEVITVPADNALYNYVPVMTGQFFAPGDYYFDIFVLPPHRVERFESSRMYANAGVLEPNSHDFLRKLVLLSPDQAIQQARLHDTLETLMLESIASFITRGVTDATWQQFVDRTQQAGVEQYLATYQEVYNAYLEANR